MPVLGKAGLRPAPTPHPYRAANGAVTYRDPDGRDVVFAPWVYGGFRIPSTGPKQATPPPPTHRWTPPAHRCWTRRFRRAENRCATASGSASGSKLPDWPPSRSSS